MRLRDWAEYLKKQEKNVQKTKDGGAKTAPAAERTVKPPPPRPTGQPAPRPLAKVTERETPPAKPIVKPEVRQAPTAPPQDAPTQVPDFLDYVKKLEDQSAKVASAIADKVAARRTTDLEPWVVVPAESSAAESEDDRPEATMVVAEPAPPPAKPIAKQVDLFAEPAPAPAPEATKPAPKAEPKLVEAKPVAEAPVQPAPPKPKVQRAPRVAAPRVESTAGDGDGSVQSDLGPALKETPARLKNLLGYEGAEPARLYYKKSREAGEFAESRQELIARLIDPPLTLEETARLLNVCPTTVRRYTNKGLLKHYRTVGNQRRFRLSDVMTFMENQGRPEQPKTSEAPSTQA